MNNQEGFDLQKALTQELNHEVDARLTFFRTHFNLQWNPFPEVGVPDSEVSELASIRQHILRDIGTRMRTALQNQNLSVIVIKGDYGSGKSALLRKIVSDVNHAFAGKSEGRPKIIYVYRPSVEAHALNRTILEEIGLDDVRKMVWNLVKQEMSKDLAAQSFPDRLVTLLNDLMSSKGRSIPIHQDSLFEWSGKSIPEPLERLFDLNRNTDYRSFLTEVDRLKKNRKQFQNYFRLLLSDGLSNISSPTLSAFVALLLAYDEIEAWQSLLYTGAPTRDRAGFVRMFLQDLVRLLESDGYSYLFVVIDEFEQVTEPALLSPKDRADYTYTMMEIINRIDRGLGFIISITNVGFQKLAKDIQPLADRFVPVGLDPLRISDVRELVIFYLALARLNEENSDDLFPFSEAILDLALTVIQNVGQGGTPRNVTQFFHSFLEYCVFEGISSITTETAQAFAAHYRERKSPKSR